MRAGNHPRRKLTVLAVTMSGALTTIALAHAQTVVSTPETTTQNWASSDFTIDSTGSIIVSPTNAVNAAGSLGAFLNNGDVSSATHGVHISSASSIDSITNNGTINGSIGAGIFNIASPITTLTNTGTISGAVGIANNNTTSVIGTLTNSNIGSIAGIFNGGSITLLNNSGTISGSSNNVGIQNGGTITTLNNSGTISGSAYAINLGGTITNFTNTGTVAGNIQNNSGTTLTINGGTGSTFGLLTGYSGGTGTSDVGDILSGSGLTFSGNLLLNDNINAGTSTVTNTGVLQVNNSLGITGDYAQGSDATLLIGVSGTATTSNGDLTDIDYGRLVVAGNANLDGSNITLKSLGYSFAQGQRYVVVAAKGSLSNIGTTYSANGYTVTVKTQTDTSDGSYTDLMLTLSGGTTDSSNPIDSDTSGSSSPINNATTHNAASTLGGLYKYTGTDANLLAVFNPAAALDTADSANRAGAQLSPAAMASSTSQAVDTSSQAIMHVLASHMDTLRLARGRTTGIPTGGNTNDVGLWGQVFGGHASQGLRDDISGYRANYRGLLIGADRSINDSLRVGALLNATKTSIDGEGDNTGSSADVNSYGATAYGTYTGDPWYVNVMAGAARQQYNTTRAISYTGFSGTADGNFNGSQYLAAARAGYPFDLDAWLPGTTLTPIVGLRYSTLRQNGYTETGGAAALSVTPVTYNSLKSELGVKLERDIDTSYGMLLPSVQLGWRHEYKDSATQVGASFAADGTGSTVFMTQGATPVSDVAVLDVGVTLLKKSNLSLSAKYTLEAGGGYLAQAGSMQVSWQY